MIDLEQSSERAVIAYGASTILSLIVLAIALNFLSVKTSVGIAYAVSWIGLFGVFGIFFLVDKNKSTT